MSVKLFHAKIRINPYAPKFECHFEGHIEAKHNPDADLATKKVTVHCFDSTQGQASLNLPEIPTHFVEKLEGDHERWSFLQVIQDNQPVEILMNFNIKYQYFNTKTGQQEEYVDDNEGRNYTIGINTAGVPSLTLGKSVIAFYDAAKIPSQQYERAKLTEISYYVKNLFYHKDGGIHFEDHNQWMWRDSPEAWTHWNTSFAQAKNGEELWKITPPDGQQPEDPVAFCVFANYNDGGRFYDNNFNRNFSTYSFPIS